jgi:phenylacetate-CoA ligase
VQLDESQWWSADKLAAAQLQQFKKLIAYAASYSPFYRQHLAGIAVANLDLKSFRGLPVLTRAQLQENNEAIDCDLSPEAHGVVTESMTSGSTGYPVKFRTTALTSTLWKAINMREQLWYDASSIRPPPQYVGTQMQLACRPRVSSLRIEDYPCRYFATQGVDTF